MSSNTPINRNRFITVYDTDAERPATAATFPFGQLVYSVDTSELRICDGTATWPAPIGVSAGPRTVFVNPGGKDSNSGDSPSLGAGASGPKKSLQNALRTAGLSRGALTIEMSAGDFGNNMNVESAVTATAFTPSGSTSIPVASVPVAMVKGTTILFAGGGLAVLTAAAPVSVGPQALQVGGGVQNRDIGQDEQGSAFWDRFSSAALLPDVTSGPVGKTIIRGTLAPVGTQPITSGPSFFTQTGGGPRPAGFVTIPIAGGPFAVNQFRGKLVSAPSSPDFPGVDRQITSSDANNLFVKIPAFTSPMPDIAAGKQLLIQESASTFTFRYNEAMDPGATIDASSSEWVFEHFNPIFGDITNTNVFGSGDDVPLENGSFLFSGCRVQGDDLGFRNTKARFLNCDLDNFLFFFGFQNGFEYSSFVSLVCCTSLSLGTPFNSEINGTNLSMGIDSCDLISSFLGVGVGFPDNGAVLTITDSDFHGAGAGGGFIMFAARANINIVRSSFTAFGGEAIFGAQCVIHLSGVSGQGAIKIADKVTADAAGYAPGATVINLAAPLAAPVNHNYLTGQTIRFAATVVPVVLSAPANLGDMVLNVEPIPAAIAPNEVGLVQSASSTTPTAPGATSVSVLPTFADYKLGQYMYWFAAGGTFHVAVLSADAPAGSTVLQIFPLQDFFGSGFIPAKAAMDLNGATAGVGIQDMTNYTETTDTTLEGDPTSNTNLPTPQAEAVIVGSLGVFSRAVVQTTTGVVDPATFCRAAKGTV